MATYPGTNIPTGTAANDRLNKLIDTFMTPRVLGFRQICMYDMPMGLCPDGETWRSPFGNWLDWDCQEINKNGCPLGTSDITDFDAKTGKFKLAGGTEVGPDGRSRDVVEVTFQFDYFPVEVLEAFYRNAVQNINAGAYGSPTDFNLDSNFPPDNWDGVMTDMAFAHAMERLLLDYDLWKYRLVFAIGPNEVEGGGGDIVAQIETLKTNAEDRANKALENERFKIGGYYVSPPTTFYFDAIRGLGSSQGRHGIPFSTGRLRGFRPNRFL